MERFMSGMVQIGSSAACMIAAAHVEPWYWAVGFAVGAPINSAMGAISILESLFGDNGLYPLFKVEK